MVNLKKVSTKFLSLNIIRRVFVIIGCLLFVFSFIYPFYHVSMSGNFPTESIYYRSYEYDEHMTYPSFPFYYWFYEFWFNPFVALGMTWVLVSLFVVQILTLMFGLVFTISNRRILSFEPVIFSIATLLLMTCTGERIGILTKEANDFPPLSSFSSQYQLGYYLVYPSLVMFVFAFLLNEVRSRKKMGATETAKENQNMLCKEELR
jgi:hypothetical protein